MGMKFGEAGTPRLAHYSLFFFCWEDELPQSESCRFVIVETTTKLFLRDSGDRQLLSDLDNQCAVTNSTLFSF